MAYPTLKVSIAFDDGPYVASPTWTDITSSVFEVSIHRGRSDDFDLSFVSTANLTLNNNSRLFDPFNTSGTYANKLTPRRQIKIEGITNSVTYSLFRGFVNGFPVKWTNSGKQSTVTVEAFDLLSLLNTANLKSDFADIYTRSLNPVHYWKCNDANGSSNITDFGSQAKDMVKASANFVPKFPLGRGLAGSSADTTDATHEYTASTSPTTGDITISFWAQWNNESNTDAVIQIGGNGTNDQIVISGNQTHSSYKGLEVKTQTGGTIGYCRTNTTKTPTNVIAKHYAITYTKSSGTVEIFVNGTTVGSTATASVSGINLFPINRMRLTSITAQEIAVFNSVLTSTQIRNLYLYGDGSSSESTADRMTQLYKQTDLWDSGTSTMSSLVSVHTGSVATVNGVPDPNATIATALQDVMETEGGYLFVTSSGTIKSVNRNYLSTNSTSITSQVTVSDQPSYNGYSGEVEMWYDGDNIRNEIQVETASGQSLSAVDATSISTYGRHTESVHTQSGSYSEANDLATYWLNYYKQIVPSVSAIEVGAPTTSATQWQTLLSLDLLDRFTFVRTPSTGSAFSKDMIINGIDFSLRPKQWSMKLQGSNRFTLLPPTTSSLSVAFTHNSAVFSGYANANGTSSTVTFEYSTSANFSSLTSVTATPSTVTGNSNTLCTASVSLSAGTTYYYRIKAVNSLGTSYTSGSFQTYTLKTVRFTASGTWTKPTQPTGGAAMSSASNAFVISGGGGSDPTYGIAGGGGGGTAASSSSITLASSMVVVIGAGGSTLSNGGSSSMTNLTTGISGGLAGNLDFMNDNINGGNSGNGHLGGTGFLSLFDVSAGGGGGGESANGTNGDTTGHGGNGGAGSTIYGFSYGSGGGGGGNTSSGSNGGGSASTYGRGCDGFSSGYASSQGYGGFEYYGPAGSRSGTGWTES